MDTRGEPVDPKSSQSTESCSTEVPSTDLPVAEQLTATEQAEDQSTEERMVRLPKTVGLLLMGVGVAGLLAPGPLGTPFIILGGVVLWPSLFRAPDRWLKRKFPGPRHQALKVVERYVADLENRFPSKTQGDPNDRPE